MTYHKSVPKLWWGWLLVVSVAGSVGGLVLALGSPLFEPVLDRIYEFVFGAGDAGALSGADRVMFNVAIAVGGGLQTGASVIIAFMAYYPLRRGEWWAWVACVLGLALWLVLDTGITAWYCLNGYPRLWPKVVNDLGFVLMFGVPYVALYRYCLPREFDQGRTGEDSVTARSPVSLGETERLVLRAPQEQDLEPLLVLWTDPEVTRYVGGPRDTNVVMDHFCAYAEDPMAFVESEHEWWWSIIERSSGKLVGLCSLVEKEIEGQTEIDLGYFLLPAYWGKGYASEAISQVVELAFSGLHLESLVAVIHPENTASIGVARRLGMQLERQVLRSDGVTRQVYRLKR
jgi:ribosomal-protein-alanine N-acetyltransferase